MRLLLAIDIDWHNRGVTSSVPFVIPPYLGGDLEPDDADTPDNFNFLFGSQAGAARNVVDAALAAWENVINSFNDGNNTSDDFIVTISADMTRTTCGGGARTPGGGDPSNGIPDEGTIILNGCSNWFVDPTPTESSEFLGPIFNAFAGKAQVGSPAENLSDLYTLFTVEMAHLLGTSDDEDFLWEDLIEDNDPSIKDVGVADQLLPVGQLWRYDNGGVEALMTTNNGCNPGVDGPIPIHVAEAGPAHAITFGGKTYYGAEDVGNACGSAGERYHPSILTSRIIAEVYGYDIKSQASFPNFYTHLDSNGVLTVRGGSPGQVDANGNPFYNNTTDSDDKILVKSQGSNVVVEVDLEKQVRGTGVSSSTVFKQSFPKSSVTSIQISGFDGVYCDTDGDSVFAEYCDLNADMVLDPDGSDEITLDFTDSNWIPTGGITVDGGTGKNTLLIQGPLAQADYTITGSQIDISPASGSIQYVGFTDLKVVADPASSNHTMAVSGTGSDATPFTIELITGNGPDTVTINGTPDGLSLLDLSTLGDDDQITIEAKSASTLVEVDAGYGNDGVSVSPDAEDLGAVPQSLTLQGGGGIDILLLKDSNSLVDHDYQFAVEPTLVSRFSRDNTHSYFYDAFEQVILNAGSGNDHVAIFGTPATTDLLVNTDGGNDTIEVDSNGSDSLGTVNTILSHLVLDGGDGTQVGTDTLILNDVGDGQENIVTVTSTEVGSAPGDVFFGPGGSLQYFGMSQLTLHLGRAGDQVNVESTAAGTDTTVNAGLGADVIVVGGPPDAAGSDPKDRDDLSVDEIDSLVTVNGQQDVDTLFINDIADTTGDIATLTDMTLGLGVSDTLFGSGGGMVYDSIANLVLLWGAGNDATSVESTHNETITSLLTGNGDDVVVVSSTSGTVNDIRNVLNVHGQSGTDRLTLDDGTDALANIVTVTDQTVGAGPSDDFFGGGLVNYSGLQQLDVLGGVYDDMLFVTSTATGTETNLDGGDGVDLFTVESAAGVVDDIRSALSINGGAGATNVAALVDQLDPTSDQVTITASEVGTGPGDTFFGPGGSLSYLNLSQLNLVTRTGNDTLNLQSANDGTTMLIGGGPGDDAFSVDSNGAGTSGGTVDLILSKVDLFGGTGHNTLSLDDFGDANGDQVSIIPTGPTKGHIGFGASDDFFGTGGGVKYSGFGAVALGVSELGANIINISPAPTAAGTLIGVIDGNTTNGPADLLNLDLNGATSPALQVLDKNTGLLTSGSHAGVIYRRVEMINEVSGNPFDLMVDLNAPLLPGNDGVEDVVEATSGQFNSDKTFNLRVDGDPLFSGLEGAINSTTLIGSDDDDTFSVVETVDGLPHMPGTAPTGHTNSAFVSAGLTPFNVGIHFDGGPGAGNDHFDLSLTAPHDVAVFQDVVATANSGVVNVQGEFTLSYESLTPMTFLGAGGPLLVDATLLNKMNKLTLMDLGNGSGVISGNGRFETTTFSGFDILTVQSPQKVQLLTTHYVNSVGDQVDANPGDGLCQIASARNLCTLRAAIQETNALAGPGNIFFAIPGNGPHSIQPVSALPAITEAVTIDGYTEPGATANTDPLSSNAVLMVELDGTRITDGSSGLVITSGGSTVRGLAINRFAYPDMGTPGSPRPVPVGGIVLTGGGDNVVEGNFIGTNTAGTVAQGNNFYGIYVASADNLIGGKKSAARNLVSGNQGFGIHFCCDEATDNRVYGNLIGTDAAGMRALPNTGAGVVISSYAANNVIGGRRRGGNLISGNGGPFAPAGAPNRPYQNWPDAPFPMSGGHGSGVHIENLSHVRPDEAVPNKVIGNRIGTDVTGSRALGNAHRGVTLVFTNNATVQDNLVSANQDNGIVISGFFVGGTHHLLKGNLIGTDAQGVAPLGNGKDGILISNASGATIRDNTVAFNRQGVTILGTEEFATGNTIQRNSIHSNNLLGIDLVLKRGPDQDGPTPNDVLDADDGPNRRQNFPSLSTVLYGGSTYVAGHLSSTPSKRFELELFSNSVVDASGFGEGQTYLSSLLVTTDATGIGSFGAFLPAGSMAGEWISAIATDLATGDTSEFSLAVRADGPGPFEDIDQHVQDLVDARVLKKKDAKKLVDKAKKGEKALGKGDVDKGVRELEKFIKSVVSLSQRGKKKQKLTAEQAKLLVDAANEAIALALSDRALRASEMGRRPQDAVLTERASELAISQAMAFWGSRLMKTERNGGLAEIEVSVRDLPGSILGLSLSNQIWIDEDAAGHGWYVPEIWGGPGGNIGDRMDLLTVAAHEVGHVLGLDHIYSEDVMGAFLAVGESHPIDSAALSASWYGDALLQTELTQYWPTTPTGGQQPASHGSHRPSVHQEELTDDWWLEDQAWSRDAWLDSRPASDDTDWWTASREFWSDFDIDSSILEYACSLGGADLYTTED